MAALAGLAGFIKLSCHIPLRNILRVSDSICKGTYTWLSDNFAGIIVCCLSGLPLNGFDIIDNQAGFDSTIVILEQRRFTCSNTYN